MLEGNVEIGQHFAVRHQRQNVVHMGIGIDIVQPHPHAERAERLGKTEEARLVILPAPGALGVTEIEPIGARILRDDEKLLDARGNEALGLAHDVAQRPALEPPAQGSG